MHACAGWCMCVQGKAASAPNVTWCTWGAAHLVVDAALLVARAGEVAAATGDERDCQRLPEHGQRALLPEAMDQRHHPAVVAQRIAQRPAVGE